MWKIHAKPVLSDLFISICNFVKMCRRLYLRIDSYLLMPYELSQFCFDLYIIGPVELAAVGVAIAVFNQVSKIAIFPLVSITTSFVAEEDATSKIRSIEEEETDNMEKALPKSSEMKESSTQAGRPNFVFSSLPFILSFLSQKE